MDAVFLKVLNLGITAGWLVIAILLLRPLLKKAPRWVMGVLWGMVALRLCLPFSVPSILSLIPSAETFPPAILEGEEPYLHSGMHHLNSVSTVYMQEHLAPTPDASADPMQILMTVCGIIWAVGMAAMVAYMLVSYLQVRRRVAAAVDTDGIWLADDLDAVFILGVFRPRIYAPSDMSPEDRAYALAHERAHLKRLDHLWKPLGFLLLAVYWFHPLLWAAYILMCRDIEISCDEKVIETLGEEHKKSYSHALIRAGACRRMVAVCPVAFGEVSIKERVRHVLSFKRPAVWVVIVTLLLCAVTAVCFLTDPPRETTRLAELQEEYPEYFGLSASEGLVIYAAPHPDEEGMYFCHIDTGSTEKPELEKDASALRLISHDDLHMILASYDQAKNRIRYHHGKMNADGTASFELSVPTRDLSQLKLECPDFFELDTRKGLDVYVYAFAEGAYSCQLLSGADQESDLTELMSVRSVSVEEMKLILSTYNISEKKIRYQHYRHLASSYLMPSDFDAGALFE